jgi:spore maturation protein CgeB
MTAFNGIRHAPPGGSAAFIIRARSTPTTFSRQAMKILLAIPGHLRTVPMGRFSASALQELGHEVVVFDYAPSTLDKLRQRLFRPAGEARAPMNRRLRRAIEAERPDLFVTLFGFDVSRESLEFMRAKKLASVCWWINDPFQFERSLKKAPCYDFVFSNSSVSPLDYRRVGVRNAHFLPTACAPAVHRVVPAAEPYRCEVCFAGDWSPLRELVMEGLAARFEARVFGPWQRKLKPDSPLRAKLVNGFFSPEEMATMFASAQVVLNVHTWFGEFDHGLNPRLFEAAGCASYQLVDWKREIPQLFEVPAQIVCYRTLDEIPELVAAALAAPTATRETGLAAQRRAYQDHTYRARMQTLLDTVGRSGA